MSDKYKIDIRALAKALQSGRDQNGKDSPSNIHIKSESVYKSNNDECSRAGTGWTGNQKWFCE